MLYTSQTDIKRVPLYIEHLLNEVSNNIRKILYALVVPRALHSNLTKTTFIIRHAGCNKHANRKQQLQYRSQTGYKPNNSGIRFVEKPVKAYFLLAHPI